MKKHFLTGFAIFLPAILTLAIVAFLVNLLTNPFVNAIEELFNYYQVSGAKPWSFNNNLFLLLLVRLFILFIIFAFIILIGFLTQTFLMFSLINMTDKLMQYIPVFNKVYTSLQEVTRSLFSSKGSSFKQVVLVPYPNETSLSIGFITTDITSSSNNPQLQDKIPVFVPGTPNPTFGFILFFSKDQVIYSNMKIEEAFKFLVSCGIMLSPAPGNLDETKA